MFSTNAPANQTINELTLLTVTNAATDANTNLTLNYTVMMRVDTNAMIANGWPLNFATTIPPSPTISTNGVITWTPSEKLRVRESISSLPSLPTIVFKSLSATNSLQRDGE